MTKTEFVLKWLDEHEISFDVHYHTPLPTIEEALAYWKNIDSTHCKNLFSVPNGTNGITSGS